VKVTRLSWLGVRTTQFEAMARLYRDVLGLEIVSEQADDARFALADGTEVHVYGPADADHAFFGGGPVVALHVDDFDAARARLIQAGIECIGEPQRDGANAWNHFRAPDGNIYEIMGPSNVSATDAAG
jgi:catechol 2,3-dioxygenase-like lactoylglutathione lyase family enzyme